MDTALLAKTAAALVAPGKGLLAADESAGTCAKRFAVAGVADSEEMRRTYREMLFTTPVMKSTISGVILHDETIRQRTSKGVPFADYLNSIGVIPGIKVDGGTRDMAGAPGEIISDGLDGLQKRMKDYFAMGARFAKWRAVITIGHNVPTARCIWANAHALARYATICQEAGIVPVVEPEVLLDGDYDINTSFNVTEAVLRTLMGQMADNKVSIEHTILKASMVISGNRAKQRAHQAEVGQRTVECLKRTVPGAMPGIVFLSGGQSDIDSAAHLNEMNKHGNNPWPLTFSYSRALHFSALKVWKGKQENYKAAQAAFAHRCKMNSLASRGKWTLAAENAGA
jgi:fructose-bisphosphate aldolase, class I